MSKILGLARLQRKLDRLPKVALAMIRNAMEESADEIVALAVRLAPEDSGDLKASIGWTWGKAPRGSITLTKLVSGALGADLTLTIYAGDDRAYYARWVEFGTAAHNSASGGGTKAGTESLRTGRKTKKGVAPTFHPGSPAQPFFYPAWRANKKAAKTRIRAAIRKAARLVAQGG